MVAPSPALLSEPADYARAFNIWVNERQIDVRAVVHKWRRGEVECGY